MFSSRIGLGWTVTGSEHMFDYAVVMSWLPRIREVGWYVTGVDVPAKHVYAVRRLFIRLEQDLDGTGEWTLELRDCSTGAEGWARKVYGDEGDARLALQLIYGLARHLCLPHEQGTRQAKGRWEVRSYGLSRQDKARLARAGNASVLREEPGPAFERTATPVEQDGKTSANQPDDL